MRHYKPELRPGIRDFGSESNQCANYPLPASDFRSFPHTQLTTTKLTDSSGNDSIRHAKILEPGCAILWLDSDHAKIDIPAIHSFEPGQWSVGCIGLLTSAGLLDLFTYHGTYSLFAATGCMAHIFYFSLVGFTMAYTLLPAFESEDSFCRPSHMIRTRDIISILWHKAWWHMGSQSIYWFAKLIDWIVRCRR